MNFGRVDQIGDIDFSLPPDDILTEDLWTDLAEASKAQPLEASAVPPQIHIGCTEWGRKNWIGNIYPKGTAGKDFLSHYVKQFNAIELNTLFYHLQPKHIIERWASAAGPDFRFCPKFSNSISHYKQLNNAGHDTDLFMDHMLSFGRNLGPCFLQLSDTFGVNRASILQQYIRQLPLDFKVSLELREEGWFTRRAGDTWQILREQGVGTVITDTPGRRDCLHMVLTAPFVFIRYVGHNMDASDNLRLDAWVDRIAGWIGRGLREVYFFVHNPEEERSPQMVKYLVERFNKVCGTKLRPPRLLSETEGTPLSLF